MRSRADSRLSSCSSMRDCSNLPCNVEELTDPRESNLGIDPTDAEPALRFADLHSVRTWADAFLGHGHWERPLVVYCVRSALGDSLGFVPFATQRVFRINVRSLAGYYLPFRTLAVSGDLVARDAFCKALAGHLTRHPPSSVLRLGPLSSADIAIDRFIGALRENGWRQLHRSLGNAYVVDLAGGPSRVEDRASASLLKNILYERRRLLRQHGEFIVQRHELRPGCEHVVDDAARIELASWVGREFGQLKFAGASRRRYWLELAALPNRASKIAIWLLQCGGEAIAFSANIETPDTVYIFANSFDEAWKTYSPGSILAYDVIVDACQRGMRWVDWGQGDSGYKSRWGAEALTKLYDVMLFRPGVLGTALFSVARRAVPDWKRRSDG
jgi:hypothetical protein